MDIVGQPFFIKIPDTVTAGRADQVLHGLFEDFSRTQIQKAFKAGLVRCGDAVLTQRSTVGPGDALSVQWLYASDPLDLTPAPMALDILYEDADLLVLNKAVGQVVHPGSGTDGQTLVHGLLHYCQYEAEGAKREVPLTLSSLGGPERPGVVHRLDKDTTGVILFAKTDQAYLGLVQQFQDRSVQKTYWALVAGVPPLATGVCRGPIDRHASHRHKMQVCVTGGRAALTYWTRIKASEDKLFSLLECTPHTGRTHQIRVHLAHMGYPVLGDSVYGYRPLKGPMPAQPERVLLHAHHINFEHPVTAEPMTFTAPVPEDFSCFFPVF